MSFTINYPDGFSPESRVWVYQTNRFLLPEEVTQITATLEAFTSNWLSHSEPVKGTYRVVPEGFIMLMADTAVTEVSGCSTDSSVRVIKELEAKYHLDLFNRQTLAFFVNNEVVRIPLSQLGEMIIQQKIQPETPYFNNMVQTLGDLKSSWLMPAGNSWLAKKFETAKIAVG
jgi:hypothetical protein